MEFQTCQDDDTMPCAGVEYTNYVYEIISGNYNPILATIEKRLSLHTGPSEVSHRAELIPVSGE